MEKAAKATSQGYGWVVLAVTFVAGFTAPANMAKAPAIAPTLMGYFNIGPSQFGLLVSVFFLLGFLLAFPTAAIIRKLGLRVAISAAVICGALGSIIGAITPDFTLFVIGRLLEGAGMGIMGVAGASAITPWFPKASRGLPLGIWAIWVAAGMVVCPMIYGWIADPNGLGMDFHAIWWVTFVFDIIALVLFNLFYRAPDTPYDDSDLEGTKFEAGVQHKITDIFKSKALIALGLIFLFDEMAFMTINGFFVDYQTVTFGYDQIHANVYVTAFAVSGAIFAPLAGKLSDFFKTRKWVLLVGLIAGTFYTAIVFTNQIEWAYWPLTIIAGMTGGMVPSIIWIATPETVPGDLVPSANALVATTQNFGMFVGPLLMGVAIEALNYGTATLLCLVPLYFVCLIVWIVGLRKTLK
jgi:MFS family permease